MNASEYANWVKANRPASEKDEKLLQTFRSSLLDRFHEDLFTNDESVMEVVNASNYAEGKQNPKCPSTLQLVDQLLELSAERPMLRVSLLKKKAYLLGLSGNSGDATATRLAAMEILEKLHLEIDRQRMENMVQVGSSYLQGGQLKDAETMFLDVMSYPWHLVSDSASFAFLRERYIEAAKGLILCRKGNLESLKNIYFVPATNSILKPILDKAIFDAQR